MNIEIDPTASFEGASNQSILDACGLITNFALEAYWTVGSEDMEDFCDVMMRVYGFGFGWEFGGRVDDKGFYNSEGDKPLAPYVKIVFDSLAVYIYPYAITAVVDTVSNRQKVTRMD
jgi:hypothetical protein